MPSRKLADLTAEQAALLSVYREKWRSLSLSTERIDQQKAAEAIRTAYRISDHPEPKILFYSSPFAVIQQSIKDKDYQEYLGRSINTKFSKRVLSHLHQGLFQQLEQPFGIWLRNQVQFPEFPHYSTEKNPQPSYFSQAVSGYVERQLIDDFERLNPEIEFTDLKYFTDCLNRPVDDVVQACLFDFCISVLGLHHDRQKWQALQKLIQHCGFLFQYEKVCIACDRPSKLVFDSNNLLHRDKPALQFADGYSVYTKDQGD